MSDYIVKEFYKENPFSLRVFRRNLKNIIIVWDSEHLDDSLKKCVSIMVMHESAEPAALDFSKFLPDAPEKFSQYIDGVVIPHLVNNLDPLEQYTLKLTFGDKDLKHEELKEVLPLAGVHIPNAPKPLNVAHMYGYDYKRHKWVPLPVDQSLLPQG